MVPEIPDDPFGSPTRLLGSAMPQIDQIMPKESVGKIVYKRPSDAKSIDDFLKIDDEEAQEFTQEISKKILEKLESEDKKMKKKVKELSIVNKALSYKLS